MLESVILELGVSAAVCDREGEDEEFGSRRGDAIIAFAFFRPESS